jgi:ATP-dependent helicase/DNAse subunit B
MAGKVGAQVMTQHCTGGVCRDAGVQALLDTMFAPHSPSVQTGDTVKLRGFDSVEEECRHSVGRIRELAASGVRFRDIHVACTDPAAYEAALRSACLSGEVPIYFSGETDILGKPVLGAVMSALSAAVGPMDYADVALYLKSGLPALERDRCDRLDCYAYRWNLRGSQWERPLEFHPRGFGLDWQENDRAELALLEEDRQAAMVPLLRLRDALKTAADTGEMVLAVHRFLEDIQLRQRLEILRWLCSPTEI